MKKFLFVLLILAFVVSLTGQEKEDSLYDFRKVKWGMNEEQVIKAEKLKVMRSETIKGRHVLGYVGKIANLDCFIIYYLIEQKLYRAVIVSHEKHSNKNFYIDDYKHLKELLVEKYGEPITDDSVWSNNLYKSNYEDYGFAISMGYLTYGTHWENLTTEIFLKLWGDNFKINLAIEYKSKELKGLEKKLDDREVQDKL